MPQTLFQSAGVGANNSNDLNNIKDAGMAVSGVKWVNVNNDNIVVTHEEVFDAAAFTTAVNSAGADIS